jgi:hypothetical protein
MHFRFDSAEKQIPRSVNASGAQKSRFARDDKQKLSQQFAKRLDNAKPF